MRDHTGCAGVMIGRGAFGNPWLFRDGQAQLRGLPAPPAPAARERFQVALDHARLALRLQGDTRKTVIEFRKHLGWYTRGLHGASDLRQRLFQIESVAEAEAIFLEYLEPVAHVA
jgi:tRNA-dihydrouridine synthase